MQKCQLCGAEFEHHNAYANHVRWTHKREQSQKPCELCGKILNAPNYAAHVSLCKIRHPCKRCGKLTLNADFCSHNCSAIVNNKLGKTGYQTYRRKYNLVKEDTYHDVCFRHWGKKCVICGWNISVDVHHVDDNHHNNDEKNLIPLCANHHMMTRMNEHKETIKKQIIKLIEEKFNAPIIC